MEARCGCAAGGCTGAGAWASAGSAATSHSSSRSRGCCRGSMPSRTSCSRSSCATRILRLPSARVMTNGARRPAPNGNGHANGLQNGDGNGNGHGGVHANGKTVEPWWRVVIPARERPRKVAKVPRLPLWRRAAALAANAYRLVLLNGLRSWSRDARQTTPVIGTIALLLTLCGTLALIGIAVEGAVAEQ